MIAGRRTANCRAADSKLAEIAHETLVIYARFLAELLITLSKPERIIGEGAAVAQGDNQYNVTLSCSTRVPDSVAELPGWVSQNMTYDESRIRLALQCAQEGRSTRFTIEPNTPLAPAPKERKV